MAIEVGVPAQAGRPGLLLRPWAAQDAESLAQAHRDPALRRWLLTSLDSAEAAGRWIEAQARGRADGTRFSFAVVEQDGMQPVGHVAVKRASAGADCAEIGYWTSAHARGRGIAPRAVDAAARWALHGAGGPGLARLELLHPVGNTASCRVAAKCGFTLLEELAPLPPAFPRAGHRHGLGRSQAR